MFDEINILYVYLIICTVLAARKKRRSCPVYAESSFQVLDTDKGKYLGGIVMTGMGLKKAYVIVQIIK